MQWLRNLLTHVPKGHAEMVAAAIRTIISQPTPAKVDTQFDTRAMMLRRRFPELKGLMQEAKTDVPAFGALPRAHWKQIWSTNPLEQESQGIKRRTDVVGVFPNPAGLLRLVGCVLIEQHDEWAVADRCYSNAYTMVALDAKTLTTIPARLTLAERRSHTA